MTTPQQLRKIEAIHHKFQRLEHDLVWHMDPGPKRRAALQKLIEARDLELVKARGSHGGYDYDTMGTSRSPYKLRQLACRLREEPSLCGCTSLLHAYDLSIGPPSIWHSSSTPPDR